MARPSIYTPKLARAICDRLAEGESLASICRDDAMPAYSTAKAWEIDKEEFSALSMRAREIGIHKMADDCLAIADDGRNDFLERLTKDGEVSMQLNPEHIQRSRLRIDTRMRLIGKWLPKVYGEKQTVDFKGVQSPIFPPPFANV